MVTMMLGDFGADVIKIEAPQRLDGWRGAAGLTVDRAYERNPLWNAINRGKLGLSLDLASDAGRALFLRLVADADVVVENFTPRVMGNLGLGYDVLRAANPRLVMAALSGFGQTGPWRDYVAFAFPTEDVSGLAYLTGQRDGPPMLIGASVTDAMAAAMGAFAVVAALERRERARARATYIDLSQIETLTTYIAGELVQAAGHRRRPGAASATTAPGCARTGCTRARRPASSLPSPCATTTTGSGCAPPSAATTSPPTPSLAHRRRPGARPAPGSTTPSPHGPSSATARPPRSRCRPPACPPPSPCGRPSWPSTSSCGPATSSASSSGRRSAPTRYPGPVVRPARPRRR